jgi:hypothetical protein
MTTASCKYREHEILARRVELPDIEIILCSFCKRHEKKYLVGEGSTWYSEYVQQGCKYNTEGIPLGDWNSLDREEARLKHKQKLATLEVVAAQQAALARIARIARIQQLEKQQEFPKKKGTEMLKRGLKMLDKLDKAEAKEKEERGVQERAAINSAALADPSWLEPLSKEQLNHLFLDFPESTAELQPLY